MCIHTYGAEYRTRNPKRPDGEGNPATSLYIHSVLAELRACWQFLTRRCYGKEEASELESGRAISQRFIHECLWPLLGRELPGSTNRLAIAIIGIGSDVTGLDDEISRDHHWGPRANILILPEDTQDLVPQVESVLARSLPKSFEGFPIHVDNTIMTGVCCSAIDRFFEYFLGTAKLPQSNADWISLTEVDLYHVTSGLVAIDEPGEITRRRDHLSYYPDVVWKKRIADWCMYITGRDAPYNMHRVIRRDDLVTARIYRAAYCKQVMELCFALNRQYSPYTKWLNRLYRGLPRFVDEIAPLIDDIITCDDFERAVQQMISANYVLAEAIATLGLASPPVRKEFDDSLTALTLYDSAAEIYSTVPSNLVPYSFNRTEMWERLVRDALFATEQCHNTGRSGPPAVHQTHEVESNLSTRS